jgi:hypothetical protein
MMMIIIIIIIVVVVVVVVVRIALSGLILYSAYQYCNDKFYIHLGGFMEY